MKRLVCGFGIIAVFAVVFQMVAEGTTNIDVSGDGKTLTLLVQFEQPPRDSLWSKLAEDLVENAAPGGWALELVQQTMETAGREFGEMVMVKMSGTCRPPAKLSAAWRPEPLGLVRQVDGIFQPIIQIDCDRVAEAVSRAHFGLISEREYASALAKVIRHEVRHIVLKTTTHERAGEYRARLTAEELIKPEHGRRGPSAAAFLSAAKPDGQAPAMGQPRMGQSR